MFFLWLGCSVIAAAAEAPKPQKWLILHDFDRADIPDNLRGNAGTWNLDPSDPKTEINFILDDSVKHGEKGNSLYLTYKLNPDRSAQCGFWMNLNNLDARDYDHVEFWVKGDPKLGFAKSFKIEFKQPIPGSPDENYKGSYVVTGVTDQWQKISVPLNVMNGIVEWKDLEEFVITLHSRRADVKQGGYYFDDIALVKTGNPGPNIHDQVLATKKKEWEAQRGGEKQAIPEIQKRLVGWPKTALADKASFPADDKEFLMRIARDTWKGLDQLSDKEHGLPLDTVRFSKGSVALADSRIGDYTNITNVGMYLLSIVGAYDLKLITKDEAMARLKTTLTTLEKLPSYNGFLYNYYDTTSAERTSNFVSFVDSAWLTAGMIVVRDAFPELNGRCSAFIKKQDYRFFYDDVEQLMSHGFYVNIKYPSEYQYGSFYTEPRAGSLIAIAKGDVPEEHWFKMTRTFPADYGWQSRSPVNRKEKKVHDVSMIGGYYEWNGVKYVPSWGGSLFEALMPTLIIDEAQYAPDNLGKNDQVHAAMHKKFALEEMKYPVWGMSPCSVPSKDDYSEYGVKMLGSKGYKPGAVTPHVTALALNVAPADAIANFRKLIEKYDVYGEYGFYDSVDPVTGDVAYKYLALDQGMIFVSLANYLGDHCIQRHFANDPMVRKTLPMLKEEKFFE
ncbi:MAG: DUF3131 domain-containing protein [Verrucomicrobiae bacterium]|nr:DUF3131 domain-containing protein [Verrucomicrobiae bacterium]